MFRRHFPKPFGTYRSLPYGILKAKFVIMPTRKVKKVCSKRKILKTKWEINVTWSHLKVGQKSTEV